MKTVSIHDAKTNLSKYIASAKNGEKIYIGGFGKAEVVLTAINKSADVASKRDLSPLLGAIKASPDAFSKETDKELADLILNGGEL